jgi:hypothetical protein
MVYVEERNIEKGGAGALRRLRINREILILCKPLIEV